MTKPATRSRQKAPWNRKAPRKTRHRSLTTAQKSRARRMAARAGRRYPNLIDNMRVAKEAHARKSG